MFGHSHRISLAKKVTLKELQSLIALLNFACNVIVSGRVFIRRLINLTIGIKAARHFIRSEVKSRFICSEVKSKSSMSYSFMSVNAGKAENDRGRERGDKKISLSLD